jgi:hypothetical protein
LHGNAKYRLPVTGNTKYSYRLQGSGCTEIQKTGYQLPVAGKYKIQVAEGVDELTGGRGVEKLIEVIKLIKACKGN